MKTFERRSWAIPVGCQSHDVLGLPDLGVWVDQSHRARIGNLWLLVFASSKPSTCELVTVGWLPSLADCVLDSSLLLNNYRNTGWLVCSGKSLHFFESEFLPNCVWSIVLKAFRLGRFSYIWEWELYPRLSYRATWLGSGSGCPFCLPPLRDRTSVLRECFRFNLCIGLPGW